ncbi:MAG: Tex family protein [Acidobacteriota bacterium]
MSSASASSSSAPSQLDARFIRHIAEAVGCRPAQVEAASALLAAGATVPYTARYPKQATGGLDDGALEALAKQRGYFLELMARRDAIRASIDEQGKLSDELADAIDAATTKQALEDLYLPYKPKRRTRAQIARERGLAPLADAVFDAANDPSVAPDALATPFVAAAPDGALADAAAALAGARDILAERLAEDAAHRAGLRTRLQREGTLSVRVLGGQEDAGQVYRDYFDHREPLASAPSHRVLAILRGERDGILLSDLALDDAAEVERLAASWQRPLDTPCGRQLRSAAEDGYRRLLRPSITNEVRAALRVRAETEAIRVFRANLEALLMQAPIGQVPVMGLDPGIRTGCKLAVVDATGRVVATDVLHGVGDGRADASSRAAAILVRLARAHRVHAIAIGNGTASRETERFVRTALKDAVGPKPQADDALARVIAAIVPETGASVYSASAVARDELPDLDVSLRGAVSIARRLQDPLAELVKIEPKALGVGQYQHDVDQRALEDELDLAVEAVVNRVGVELNTASAALLRRVAGLSVRAARSIVKQRDAAGAFASRRALLDVAGIGPKTFEQAAGFLRVQGGAHPLDRTAVHPERYAAVEKMARAADVALAELVGDRTKVAALDFGALADAAGGLGAFTLADIRAELARPGRDPRPAFEVPAWRDDVVDVADLHPGMVLEGRVSNVTNFGAFVDLGVKRDGLVHLSELANRWVDDPREVVQVGQIVKIKVLEVDAQRGRISLSMKALMGDGDGKPEGGPGGGAAKKRGAGRGRADGKGRGRRDAAPSAQRPATVDDLRDRWSRR